MWKRNSVLIFPPFVASKQTNTEWQHRGTQGKAKLPGPWLNKFTKQSPHQAQQWSSLSHCKYLLSIQNHNANKGNACSFHTHTDLSPIVLNDNSVIGMQQYMLVQYKAVSFGGSICFSKAGKHHAHHCLAFSSRVSGWVSFSELPWAMPKSSEISSETVHEENVQSQAPIKPEFSMSLGSSHGLCISLLSIYINWNFTTIGQYYGRGFFTLWKCLGFTKQRDLSGNMCCITPAMVKQRNLHAKEAYNSLSR